MQYRVLSSDSHVMEPPDLWSKRIAPDFAERAPRFVADETADWWYQEGRRVVSMGAGIQAGAKFRPEDSGWRFKPYEGRFADVRPGPTCRARGSRTWTSTASRLRSSTQRSACRFSACRARL